LVKLAASIAHSALKGVDDVKARLIGESCRLEAIREATAGRMRLVVHGTNDFTEDITRKCVQRGISKVNHNKVIAEPYRQLQQEKGDRVPLTHLMEEATKLMQEKLEQEMRYCGSAGKA